MDIDHFTDDDRESRQSDGDNGDTAKSEEHKGPASIGSFDSFGSIGRSIQFDPFMRTRNVPFRIVGRRNSISVFNVIEEWEE